MSFRNASQKQMKKQERANWYVCPITLARVRGLFMRPETKEGGLMGGRTVVRRAYNLCKRF